MELVSTFGLPSAAGPFSLGAVLSMGTGSTTSVVLNGTVGQTPGGLAVTQVHLGAALRTCPCNLHAQYLPILESIRLANAASWLGSSACQQHPCVSEGSVPSPFALCASNSPAPAWPWHAHPLDTPLLHAGWHLRGQISVWCRQQHIHRGRGHPLACAGAANPGIAAAGFCRQVRTLGPD